MLGSTDEGSMLEQMDDSTRASINSRQGDISNREQRFTMLAKMLDSDDDQDDASIASVAIHCGTNITHFQAPPELRDGDCSRTSLSETVVMTPNTCSIHVELPLCRWKSCKKVSKSGSQGSLLMCGKRECEREVHNACRAEMLESFGAADNFNKVVCNKRCYNALVKEAAKALAPPTHVKKRVHWHNDGPSDGVSSLSILLEWLTTGDNYGRYRGGESQTGETKTKLEEKISRLISEKNISTVRSAKDITNKISSLESTFRTASDWLAATGSGVTDEGDLRRAVLGMCPEYYQLADTMNNRPSTRPLLLNTDPNAHTEDTEDEGDNTSVSSDETSSTAATNKATSRHLKRPASILISIAQTQSKKHRKDDISSQPSFLKLKEVQLVQQRELQLLELEVRNKAILLQEKDFDSRQKHMENEERVANAQASKLRAEAEHWNL